ncbi:MAG: hypothetical protein AAGD47_15110, partial [Pseudomonadota bacterium]
ENGKIVSVVTLDDSQPEVPNLNPPPDFIETGLGYSWALKATYFDDSRQVTHRYTAFDDQDADLILFEDGQKTERQMIDYDNDELWYALRIVYDGAGKIVERIEYADEGELPDDFVLGVDPRFSPDDTIELADLDYPFDFGDPPTLNP